MWSLFKSLGRVSQIGLIGALLGFGAGMAAVIAVDPVVGISVVAGCVALLLFCFWFFFGPEVRRRRLQARGVPAEAVSPAVEETGVTVQSNYPMARFLFEVRPPAGEPYRVKAKCLLDRFEVPACQPGSVVRVLIDPDDRRKFTLA